jgi:uncharacterized membrane protein
MSKWYERPLEPDILFSIITIIILSIVSVSFIFVLVNVDALKALIEAEATILGFFGLISVYWFTSMDSRRDRLEQEKHEYEFKKLGAETGSLELEQPTRSNIKALTIAITDLEQKIDQIQTLEESLTNEIYRIGIFLVISLVANIGLLGLQSTYTDALKNFNYPYSVIVGLAAGIPTILFLESVWFIFGLLRRMGKKPKQEKKEHLGRAFDLRGLYGF